MRMMAQDGTIGDIPAEHVAAAQAEGLRVMSDEDMAALYNRQEVERRLFEKSYAKRGSGSFRLPRGKGRW